MRTGMRRESVGLPCDKVVRPLASRPMFRHPVGPRGYGVCVCVCLCVCVFVFVCVIPLLQRRVINVCVCYDNALAATQGNAHMGSHMMREAWHIDEAAENVLHVMRVCPNDEGRHKKWREMMLVTWEQSSIRYAVGCTHTIDGKGHRQLTKPDKMRISDGGQSPCINAGLHSRRSDSDSSWVRVYVRMLQYQCNYIAIIKL